MPIQGGRPQACRQVPRRLPRGRQETLPFVARSRWRRRKFEVWISSGRPIRIGEDSEGGQEQNHRQGYRSQQSSLLFSSLSEVIAPRATQRDGRLDEPPPGDAPLCHVILRDRSVAGARRSHALKVRYLHPSLADYRFPEPDPCCSRERPVNDRFRSPFTSAMAVLGGGRPY